MTFDEMFFQATENEPYPWQVRFKDEFPSLVSIPTGLGKTAGVILGWLWRRRFTVSSIRDSTPRRLVYCLPMRVLVEQTKDAVVKWLENLELYADKAPELHPEDQISVHVLMGGDLEMDWDRWPERDQILIGTQDMLLSRSLNRGYAMSRYRWPMQFGLLNNDCLWVMDEVQLMGNGLATTTQLQSFRQQFGTILPVKSIWMSATMRKEWLTTVDFVADFDAKGSLVISEADQQNTEVNSRLNAIKPIKKASFEVTIDGKAEADLAISLHSPETRTLVVANTVKRAQAIFGALQKMNPSPELVLLHSRFRQYDRDKQLEKLLATPSEHGIIVVSTQVVEAGVDVSAKVLITDLAPWPSLIQRFGRCNRKGEFNADRSASIVWIAQPNLDNDKELKAAPYNGDELRAAASRLEKLKDVGPAQLPTVDVHTVYSNVLRRKDLIELFDTTPDLAGADIDVSRFIRENDENHVQVFWRNFVKSGPTEEETGPAREELCTAPIGDINMEKFQPWRWDYLEMRWEKARVIFPGLILMLHANKGGYDASNGWTGRTGWVEPIKNTGDYADANDSDHWSEAHRWQTISEHSTQVVAETENLLMAFSLMNSGFRDELLLAARWHDSGKIHDVYQNALPDNRPTGLYAKAKGKMKKYDRPGFRHELASAIIMLCNGHSDLAAYLAASHHGKVRLSIRSLPHEKRPQNDNERRYARGVWDGETLTSVDIGGGVIVPETKLTLSYMDLGDDRTTGPSWLSRMLALRDTPELGPFRLAFLEALIRIADWRASKNLNVALKEVVKK